MFKSDALVELTRTHKQALCNLGAVEKILRERFVGLEEPIRALVLAVASGEPLLLVGPPGTAKSRLIRAFCGLTGLLDEQDPGRDQNGSGNQNGYANQNGYFEYLLTPFTEPGELFGFYDISQMSKTGQLNRMDKGMMQNATVVYLDEVFNGSSAILNSILAFMNERIFHDRGVRKRVAMQYLFAATNQIPEAAELRAVYDRFVLRCEVANVKAEPKALADLAYAGWLETYSQQQKRSNYAQLLSEMQQFRHGIARLTDQGKLVPQREQPFYNSLAQLVEHARQYELSEMSNRRLVKIVYIMLIHRIYEAAQTNKIPPDLALRAEELQLIPRFFLDQIETDVVERMMRVEIRYE